MLCCSGRGEAAHGVSHSPNQHVALEKVALNAGWHLKVGKNTLQGHSALKSDHPMFFFSHRARVHPGVYPPESSKAAFLSPWKTDEVFLLPLLLFQRQNPTEQRLTKSPKLALCLWASFLDWIKSLNTWL